MRLRSLGFKKGTRSADGATIQWDEQTLMRAMEAYGLRDSTHSAHSTQSMPLTPGDEQANAECVECDESERGVGGSDAHIPPVAAGQSLQPDGPAPKPNRPCYACHVARFWLDTLGVWKCLTCHPPADEGLVQESLDLGDDAKEQHPEGG